MAIPGERVDGHDFAAGGGERRVPSRSSAPARRAYRPSSSTTPSPRSAVSPATSSTSCSPRCSPSPARRARPAPRTTSPSCWRAGGATIATEGNRNNEIGVPLTVLRATPETRYLAVEMGARGVGHIAELCSVAPPRVAAVLNVGTAHIGEFGSREAIARAKGEIVEALPADGTAVLNADDPLVVAMAARTSATRRDLRCRAATSPGAASSSTTSADPAFELGHDGAWSPVRLLEAGAHQVPNAAAAAAMAAAAGIAVGRHRGALPSARSLSPWRMALHERADGLVVVNDAYNANPASMAAALDALAAIGGAAAAGPSRCSERCWSWGSPRPADHVAVGEHAARLGDRRHRDGRRRRSRDRDRRTTYAGLAGNRGAHGGPRAGRGLAATQCRRPGRRAGQGVARRRPRARRRRAGPEQTGRRPRRPSSRKAGSRADEGDPAGRRSRPGVLPARHPGGDPAVHQARLRPGDPRRRPDQPPHQARHAHDGRRSSIIAVVGPRPTSWPT